MAEEEVKKNFLEMSWKERMLGSYDFKYLCMPVWPFGKTVRRKPPTFFGTHSHLGLVVALIMGLQHALAMVGGLITPPLLIGFNAGDPDIQQYLIQASLLVCGIMTFFQVLGIKIPGTKWQIGSGILSVMGVSFTTFPIGDSVVKTLMNDHGNTFTEAYGKLLGTIALCGMVPVLLSFLPIKALKKIFPPIVCGVTITLIGVHLAGVGIASWGGGAACFAGPKKNLCTGNGDVLLPFGSQQYVGLGFLVFVTIVFMELFGSPFMRNCSAMLALLFGYFVAALAKYEGNRYITSEKFDRAPVVTFLWVHNFKLGIYGPAVIPLLIVFCITSIETVGDVTATCEASRLPVEGEVYSAMVKGALLNDGFSGIFSGLATSLPLTTFAQNNGVISLTNVASREAGFACAFWLFLLGLLGKVGAFISSIPNAVLGGMTTFLFANVIASGIKIIMVGDSLDRRSRFILACSLGLGLGVELKPNWAAPYLWPISPNMSSGERGIHDAIILVLQTSFCLGAVISFILNLILPKEQPDAGDAKIEPSYEKGDNHYAKEVMAIKDVELADTHSAPDRQRMH